MPGKSSIIRGNRFRRAVESLGDEENLTSISKKIDYNKGNLSKILNNKLQPSEDVVKKFEEAFNIDITEFSGDELPDKKQGISPSKKSIPDGVPYYDIDFTLSFVGVENTQQVNPDTYVTHPFFAGCDYIVRASGQSMAKIIKHGDAIGLTRIDNWQEFIPLGEVYAIVTKNGFRMVKVITKGKDDDHFKLVSKPSDSKKDEFPDQQIRKSNIIQIYRVQASSHLF